MIRYLITAVLLATASLVHAQPVYEIGYSFNGGDAVVRTEASPFRVHAQSDSGLQLLTMAFPFATDADNGLAEVQGEVFRESGASDELFSFGWSEVVFNDVVFASSGSEPIDVSFFIRYGGTRMLFGIPFDRIAGSVFRFVLDVELNGDAREAVFVGTVTSTGGLDDELSGFIADGIPVGGAILLEGFQVSVNTPVALRLRNTKSLRVVPSEGRISLGFLPGRAPALLESVSGVFLVPDGVTVNSIQAGIRDNTLIQCLPDVDRDGKLTIFDFLAFQNLFDAGDLTADFNLDGELTIFDFLAFQNAFDAGCP